jgi:hypothetical protein
MKKNLKSKNLILSSELVRIDKALNVYDGIVLFPEKLARANETLSRVGAPIELEKY